MTKQQALRATKRFAPAKDYNVRAQRRGGRCIITVRDRRLGGVAVVGCARTWEKAHMQQRSGMFRLLGRPGR